MLKPAKNVLVSNFLRSKYRETGQIVEKFSWDANQPAWDTDFGIAIWIGARYGGLAKDRF